jgi:type II secretory pathway pseudopilin PulG
MTFIELLVVMAVMTVAITMFTSMVVQTARQRGINRENAIASNAARTMVELMRNEDFRDAFALYNSNPADDPGGAGTAPGSAFAVPQLTALASDPDGLAGEILLPVIVEETEKGTATWGVTTLDTTAVTEVLDGLLGAVGGLLGGGGGGGLLGGGGGGLLGGGGGGGGGGGTGVYYTLREDFVDARLGLPRDLNGDSLIDDLDHSLDYVVLPVHVRISWRGAFGPRHYDLYTQIARFAKVGG